MRRGSVCSRMATTSLFLLMTCFSSADEWKARHDLVSHTGVLNLAQPPSPEEVFFAGPASPAEQPGWREGLKAWRNERRALLRPVLHELDRGRPHLVGGHCLHDEPGTMGCNRSRCRCIDGRGYPVHRHRLRWRHGFGAGRAGI